MKHRQRVSTLVTYGLLASVAGITLLLPDQLAVPSAMAAADPAQVHLTGIVRDFLESYQDMEVVPAGGLGHFAGTVDLNVDGDGRPLFVETGGGGGFSIPTTNMVAHWKLDDGGGTAAADWEGPNDGTLMNGPSWTTGQVDGALRFDGVNDYVNIPSAPEIRVTGDMTIAGWFKLDADFDASSATSQILVERYQDDEHNTMIALIGADCKRPDLPKGSLCFKVEHGPTGMEFRYKWTNRRSWTAGTWYHFACTINSADSASNDMIIDGVDDTDPADLGALGLINTDYPADMRIGGKNGDFYVIPEAYLKGVMDDVMMYDVALVESDFDPGTGGFKVADQWRNENSDPIAPHLFSAGGGGEPMAVANGRIFLSEDALIDSWDSTQGTYADTKGSDAVVATNTVLDDDVYLQISSQIQGDLFVGVGGDGDTVFTDATSGVSGTTQALSDPIVMPTITVPSDFPANVGDFLRDGAGTTTLTGDLHCDEFFITNGHIIKISGDVRILVENPKKTLGFELSYGGRVDLEPGATLTVYCKAQFKLHHNSSLNLGGIPGDVTIYQVGAAALTVQQDAQFYGVAIAPIAEVRVQQTADFYGRVTADSLKLTDFGGLHLDQPSATSVCGAPLLDIAGSEANQGSGGITDASSFEAWYRDVPAVNLAAAKVISLTDDGTGVFEFLTNAFYPIDDRLFGNEGSVHNYHFTFQLAADFTFAQCTDQFVEFEGGDGVWLFIDGFLAIDLGGMNTDTPQIIEIDRLTDELGLVDGESYRMQLFYAQRTSTKPSVFKLRTNLDLSTEAIYPSISSAFD